MAIDAFFIVDTTGKGSREKELLLSEARSHAARVSLKRIRRSKIPLYDESTPRRGSIAKQKAYETGRNAFGSSPPQQGEHRSEATALRAWHGHGDPFDVVGVLPVTPRIAELMVFIRSYYVRAPLDMPPHTSSLISPKVDNQSEESYETSITALQQDTCASAYLCSIIAAMSMLSTAPDLHMEYLKIKGQAFKTLRDEILQQPDQLEPVRQSIEYLYDANVLSRNLREASIHGKALRAMLHTQFCEQGDTPLNTTLLARYIYKDALMSEHFMSKPIFNIGAWQPILLRSFKKRGFGPQVTFDVEEPLDPFIINSGLEVIFRYARQGLPAFDRPGFVYGPEFVNPFAYCAIILLQCRVNPIFATLYSRISADRDHSQDLHLYKGCDANNIITLVTAGLCAASLLFAYLFRLRVDQVFHPGPPATLLRLRNIVEKITSLRSTILAREMLHLEPSLIWISFVGAITQRATSTRWSATPQVFDDCLQTAACHLGLDPTSWDELEPILKRFVYDPKLRLST